MHSASGWKHLTQGGTTYIIKRSTDKSIVKFIVSDLVRIWVNESTERKIMSIFQELNPLIEFNDESIVQNIWSHVDSFIESKDHGDSFRITLMEDGSCLLKFRNTMDGLAFHFCLTLAQKEPLTFFEEVTRPILATANELIARQELLCSLLEKKDQEISQYKLEGATLRRHNVETQFFNKADFVINCHLGDHNSAEGIIKVLGVVNLFKRDLMPCDSTSIDMSACIKQEPDQVSAPECQESEVENIPTDCQQDVKPKVIEACALKLQKKKKPKLNL